MRGNEIGGGIISHAFFPIPNNLLICELKSVHIFMYDIVFKLDHEKRFWCQLLEEEITKCTEEFEDRRVCRPP